MIDKSGMRFLFTVAIGDWVLLGDDRCIVESIHIDSDGVTIRIAGPSGRYRVPVSVLTPVPV